MKWNEVSLKSGVMESDWSISRGGTNFFFKFQLDVPYVVSDDVCDVSMEAAIIIL